MKDVKREYRIWNSRAVFRGKSPMLASRLTCDVVDIRLTILDTCGKL